TTPWRCRPPARRRSWAAPPALRPSGTNVLRGSDNVATRTGPSGREIVRCPGRSVQLGLPESLTELAHTHGLGDAFHGDVGRIGSREQLVGRRQDLCPVPGGVGSLVSRGHGRSAYPSPSVGPTTMFASVSPAATRSS